jgi:hypothetical protein
MDLINETDAHELNRRRRLNPWEIDSSLGSPRGMFQPILDPNK